MAEEEGLNPRYSYPYGTLAMCWFQPLTHSSEQNRLAEGEGFEPRSSRLTVFKTAGFNHSPIPPKAEKNRPLTWRMQDYFLEITGQICLTAASVGYELPRSENRGRRTEKVLSSVVGQPTQHVRLPELALQWKTQP